MAKSAPYELKEVDVRLCLKEVTTHYSESTMNNKEAAIEIMKEVLRDLDRERICVVNLDAQLHPINFCVASIGTLDHCFTDIPTIFKSAMLCNASKIILLHNHPSGVALPSPMDFTITEKTVYAGQLLGIPVLDHLIIGGGTGDVYSMRENNDAIFSVPDKPQELYEKFSEGKAR